MLTRHGRKRWWIPSVCRRKHGALARLSSWSRSTAATMRLTVRIPMRAPGQRRWPSPNGAPTESNETTAAAPPSSRGLLVQKKTYRWHRPWIHSRKRGSSLPPSRIHPRTLDCRLVCAASSSRMSQTTEVSGMVLPKEIAHRWPSVPRSPHASRTSRTSGSALLCTNARSC